MMPPNNLKDLQLLLVDSDESDRKITIRSLRLIGCKVIEAANAVDACDLFRQNYVGFVLVELNMPEIDGYTTCRLLRRTHGGDAVPIIAQGRSGEKAVVVSAIKSGANDYILKPYTTATLEEKIIKNLERYQP